MWPDLHKLLVLKYKALNAVSKIFSKKIHMLVSQWRKVLSSANSRNYGIIAIPKAQGICFVLVLPGDGRYEH